MTTRELTPFRLEILLHYFYSAEPHPRIKEACVLAVIDHWINQGVMQREIYTESAGGNRITEKGNAWVNFILDTPMPIPTWIDPRTKQVIG